ncbi:hypothetical protein NM688_g1091 [Phlebia brevispora]|uniref:Uncharacterized protein n=1 Tax=Phlebia brevispora TaxID=194682 RepID=A0ACC1TCU7_9APHY|nr:hypothetical protein NM688_g1091 [Phlebia brevispora]
MGNELSNARYMAVGSFVVNFGTQLYGMLTKPNMKDIADANHFAFSPNPWFIAAFFSGQTVLQAYWIRQLFTAGSERYTLLGDNGSEGDAAEDVDRQLAAEEATQVAVQYAPIYALGNLCIAGWLFFWLRKNFTVSQILVTINTAAQLFAVARLPTLTTGSPRLLFVTHLVAKTFAGIGVLDFVDNGGVALRSQAPPSTAIQVLTYALFPVAAAISRPLFGSTLLYDLVAIYFGQRTIPGAEEWSTRIGWTALAVGAIVGLKGMLANAVCSTMAIGNSSLHCEGSGTIALALDGCLNARDVLDLCNFVSSIVGTDMTEVEISQVLTALAPPRTQPHITRSRSSSPLTKPETWKTPEITAYLGEVSRKIVTGFHKLGSHRQDSVRRVGEVIRTSIESKKIGLPLIQDLCGILREHPALIVEYAEKWLPKTQRLELFEEFARLGLFRFSATPDAPLEWYAAIEYENAVTTLVSEDAQRTQEVLSELLYKDAPWCALSAAGQHEYNVPFCDDWRRTRLTKLMSGLFISSEILPSALAINTSNLIYVKLEFRESLLARCHHVKLGNKEVIVKGWTLHRSEVSPNESEEVATRAAELLVRRLLIWRQMQHENIVPLLGVAAEFVDSQASSGRFPFLRMITPYMHSGNILEYARSLRAENVVIPFGDWLLQIINGLSYLHEHGIVHGNLHCGQILVDDDGRLRLSDFYMTILGVLSRQITDASVGRRRRHFVYWGDRYMAPELLPADEDIPNVLTHPDTSTTSEAGDIYAFASTIVELYSGMPPKFSPADKPKYTDPYDLRDWVRDGARPLRPVETAISPIPDPLWALMQTCWKENPADRPTLMEIRSALQDIFRS